jgi:DNA-binding transcriptional ArsR family regulator
MPALPTKPGADEEDVKVDTARPERGSTAAWELAVRAAVELHARVRVVEVRAERTAVVTVVGPSHVAHVDDRIVIPITYYLRMHADDGRDSGLPWEQAELAAEVFRMLADPTRVRLLWAMLDHELSVNELAAMVGKPAPSVSQHLAKLRMARLVRTRREGTQVFYRVENDHVARLVSDAVFNAEHAGPDVPSHHQREATSLRRASQPGAQ